MQRATRGSWSARVTTQAGQLPRWQAQMHLPVHQRIKGANAENSSFGHNQDMLWMAAWRWAPVIDHATRPAHVLIPRGSAKDVSCSVSCKSRRMEVCNCLTAKHHGVLGSSASTIKCIRMRLSQCHTDSFHFLLHVSLGSGTCLFLRILKNGVCQASICHP